MKAVLLASFVVVAAAASLSPATRYTVEATLTSSSHNVPMNGTCTEGHSPCSSPTSQCCALNVAAASEVACFGDGWKCCPLAGHVAACPPTATTCCVWYVGETRTTGCCSGCCSKVPGYCGAPCVDPAASGKSLSLAAILAVIIPATVYATLVMAA